MAILVTGGAGFIGSHTVIELLENNEEVIIVDNFSNSSPEVLQRLRDISQKDFTFYELDILDTDKLDRVFADHDISAVIHFAGYKAVGESVEKPLDYYHNNLTGTFSLLQCMTKHQVKNIIFSSSATVYGDSDNVPFDETMPLQNATNPYGQTKLYLERILSDIRAPHPDWSVVLLRYFNPIGAHPSGMIGEDPNDIPNNLIPYVTQVAIGKLDHLSIFGDDYPTPDGTGVRDYIHVVDLAKGHVAALQKMDQPGTHIYNLGTGQGTSVLDIVKTFETVNQVPVSYTIGPRRSGDVAVSYANADKAKKQLNWTAQHDIADMLRDAWNWQKKNPNGYKKA